jgi:homoserine kinase type II
MAVKTSFIHADFVVILSQYDLGAYMDSAAIQQGTVQTNYFLQTTQGKFVFRYYENRSRESVLFESDLLAYLTEYDYPCPTQIKNTQGTYIGEYRNKPYILFEFCDGQPTEDPSIHQWRQLVQKAAELQKLTQEYRSQYTQHRWNYDPDLCRTLASAAAARINTPSAHAKFAWLAQELTTLDLPPSLPKGICHCDFHFSNVLFQGDELVAVLDFDDANYTFLQFDLVGLIEHWAWPHTADMLDTTKARSVVQEYMRHRALSPLEQQHLYDVYKLSILFDCVWYFSRGSADDFYERRKIEALHRLGRQKFFDALFCRAEAER